MLGAPVAAPDYRVNPIFPPSLAPNSQSVKVLVALKLCDGHRSVKRHRDRRRSPHYGPIAGHAAHRRVQASAASNVATSDILFLAWIVRRIDIGDRKRPLAVNLNDGFGCGPSVMIHLGWRFSKASRPKQFAFLGVEFVSHPDVEITGEHGNILGSRVIMSGKFVFCRKL